jgi:hypothetical protein
MITIPFKYIPVCIGCPQLGFLQYILMLLMLIYMFIYSQVLITGCPISGKSPYPENLDIRKEFRPDIEYIIMTTL